MVGYPDSKINSLLQSWPAGTVAVSPWLEKRGIYQQLAFEYERAGWLRRVGRGAYARLNEEVDWTGAVFALQTQLKIPVHVGAKTALELRGLGHFVTAGDGAPAYLFGAKDQKLPAWFLRASWQRRIRYCVPTLFDGVTTIGLTILSMRNYEIRVSTAERAILEALHLTPLEQSVEEAFHLMEGLTTLRPEMVQRLLKNCRSVKVKRLFLALADRCNHQWFPKIKISQLNLGTGKRVIVPGGHLDKKYLITLPSLGNDTKREKL